MLKIPFVKLSPSENTTIIVTDPAIKKQNYSDIAKTAMAYTHLHGEQVGFITRKHHRNSMGRMEMSGGEFCGNGLLALGAYLAREKGMEKGTFLVEFSGVEHTLECEIEQLQSAVYRVKGEMPVKSYRISKKQVKVGEGIIDGHLVVMEGITHFLFEQAEKKDHNPDFPSLLKILAKEGDNQAFGALGYWMDGEEIKLSPWVYVPGIGSLQQERSCGSGSLALGLFWAQEKKSDIRINIVQPGGMIAVAIDYDRTLKKVTSASIETEVMMTLEGNMLL